MVGNLVYAGFGLNYAWQYSESGSYGSGTNTAWTVTNNASLRRVFSISGMAYSRLWSVTLKVTRDDYFGPASTTLKAYIQLKPIK